VTTGAEEDPSAGDAVGSVGEDPLVSALRLKSVVIAYMPVTIVRTWSTARVVSITHRSCRATSPALSAVFAYETLTPDRGCPGA
jgi:hypothetical protein